MNITTQTIIEQANALSSIEKIEPSKVGRFCPRVTELAILHRVGN
jgi:hypothetical protein